MTPESGTGIPSFAMASLRTQLYKESCAGSQRHLSKLQAACQRDPRAFSKEFQWLMNMALPSSAIRRIFFSTSIGDIPPRQEAGNTKDRSATLYCISI
jgi:hypothetical protein